MIYARVVDAVACPGPPTGRVKSGLEREKIKSSYRAKRYIR